MTAREIENDMKKSVGGASFITPGKLAQYLGEKNPSRVREKYLSELARIEGTNKYFIPEVARQIYYATSVR